MLDGLRKWPIEHSSRRPRGGGAPLPLLIESRIDGAFEGWQGETVFKLTNGQYWQQVSFGYVYHCAFGPAVRIVGDGASHRLFVDAFEPSIEVRLIDVVVDTSFAGECTGWDGETGFELANGERWRQVDDALAYHYAHRPRAIIYREASELRMFVDGVGSTVAVELLRR